MERRENATVPPIWVTLPETSQACTELVKCSCKIKCSTQCNVNNVVYPVQNYVVVVEVVKELLKIDKTFFLYAVLLLETDAVIFVLVFVVVVFQRFNLVH